MSFTGNEGEFISLSDAATLTENHRTNNPNAVQGHFLGGSKLKQLLDLTGCVGLRIYHGEDTTGVRQIVVVAVDGNQNDILGTSPLILDTSVMCPSICGNANDLNG